METTKPDPVSIDDAKSQVRTVQSIERAFAMVEIIARGSEPSTLADICKATGLHTSTAFHLLRTLCLVGCIRQDADKRYRIGPYIYGLAAGAMTEINLVSDAQKQMEWLAIATGETSHVAVSANDEIVILGRVEGSSAIKFSERIGSLRPAYCTALGKVMLAQFTDTKLSKYLQDTKLKAFTRDTIVSAERLRKEIQEVKKVGAAFDNCEFNSEIRCIAAPVRCYSGKVVAAIGISGPIWRVSVEQLPHLTEKVIESAVALSRELGYAGQVPLRTAS